MPYNYAYPTHTLAQEMSEEKRWNQKLKGQIYSNGDDLLSPEHYAELLFTLGFKHQRVFLNIYPHILPSREDVVEWVKGSTLTHFESRLSKDDYAVFVEDYKKRLLELLSDNTPFFYPFRRLFIWGRLG